MSLFWVCASFNSQKLPKWEVFLHVRAYFAAELSLPIGDRLPPSRSRSNLAGEESRVYYSKRFGFSAFFLGSFKPLLCLNFFYLAALRLSVGISSGPLAYISLFCLAAFRPTVGDSSFFVSFSASEFKDSSVLRCFLIFTSVDSTPFERNFTCKGGYSFLFLRSFIPGAIPDRWLVGDMTFLITGFSLDGFICWAAATSVLLAGKNLFWSRYGSTISSDSSSSLIGDDDRTRGLANLMFLLGIDFDSAAKILAAPCLSVRSLRI